MTFLELCAEMKSECAISGSLTSVVNQPDELARMVTWVSRAYDDICSRRPDWKFLRSAMTVNTVIGQQAYEITDFTDPRIDAVEVGFANWLTDSFRIYRTSAGLAAETFFQYCEYEVFRNIYMRGVLANQQPHCFTVRPDDYAILVAPNPDAIYTITGEFQVEASTLNEDDDVPLFPDRYHMAIVYLAGRRYARYEEDGGLYDGMNRDYKRALGELELDQLPQIMSGGPLA